MVEIATGNFVERIDLVHFVGGVGGSVAFARSWDTLASDRYRYVGRVAVFLLVDPGYWIVPVHLYPGLVTACSRSGLALVSGGAWIHRVEDRYAFHCVKTACDRMVTLVYVDLECVDDLGVSRYHEKPYAKLGGPRH